MGPQTLFTVPVLRYMKTHGLSHDTLAMVSVVQREWGRQEPARHLQDTDHRRGCAELADDRLPVPLLQCCHRAFRVARPAAFAETTMTHSDVDHLMIYDAFAHLPIYRGSSRRGRVIYEL